MHNYFFLDKQERQQGPIPPEKFAQNGVTPDTLVWCSGMTDWERAASVPELQGFLTPFTRMEQQPPEPPCHESERLAFRQPSQSAGTPYVYPRPDTHLVEAVIATLCCCLPFGIVAIVKSGQVSTFYARGQYDQALLCSDDARKWVVVSVICGIVSFCVYGGLSLLNFF